MTVALSRSAIADDDVSNVLGQSGSGGRAVSVADVLGQSGSGARGQSGSGGRGQSGSGGRAVSVSDVFGQSGSGGRSVVKAGAMGIVEQLITSGRTSVVVLGQEFAIDGSSASGIAVGDYVVVTVDTNDVTTLQNLAEPYVSGV